MSDDATVRTEREGAVATVVIDRPAARNALDEATKVALRDALEAVAADDAVRAVVLTGAGSAFCVGQDLGEHAAALEADAATAFDTVDEHYAPIVRALVGMAKPVVAAVEGACVGAGLGLALACDLRVLAADAKLGTAFSGIGLTCDSGLSATLVRAVGHARAAELVLLGAMFSPEEAVAWGVAGRVVESGTARAEAERLAARLAAGPTAAYAESKRLLDLAAGGASVEESLAAESAAQHRLGLTRDHQCAVAAFLAKERPTFTGS
ncbi:enoyl-CoA hydratase/isomerase family protein [Nocardioides alkalitolerans]|uniref:enoyl-CoA hydratase/isomerase family protein n=1 Tax=Nocardioides alkalitolerans TaxID=281714 RepID=UPI00040B2EA6|nr:enoyl-CoA hydratase-related protein [Nocardioides alkalitolerans]